MGRAALISVPLLLATLVPVAAEIAWTDDLGQALDAARETRRPVMVDFWAVWCAPCQEMDQTTYRDAAVVERSAAFVALKVDTDLRPGAMDRFDVDKMPTLLFLDHEGHEIGRVEGALPASVLAPLLGMIGDAYAGYASSLADLADPSAVERVTSFLLKLGNADAAIAHTRRALKLGGRLEERSRQRIALLQAEAQLAAQQTKPACALFERLAAEGWNDEIVSRARAGAEACARLRSTRAP